MRVYVCVCLCVWVGGHNIAIKLFRVFRLAIEADKRLYTVVIPGLELDTSDGKSLADALGKSLGVPSVGVPGCHLVILE